MVTEEDSTRSFPSVSFTVACGMHLHNNSTHYYDMIRENCPFILLPCKKTLFNVNNKFKIPDDFIFEESAASLHCQV